MLLGEYVNRMSLNEYRLRKGLSYHALAKQLHSKLHRRTVKYWCDHGWEIDIMDKIRIYRPRMLMHEYTEDQTPS